MELKTELKLVKGKSYDTQDELMFLALKDGTVLFGRALTLHKLWFNHGGTTPPELRGAGYVNQETGKIQFVETAFGREIYPDRRIDIAASQASLAKKIAGQALKMILANEVHVLRRLADNPLHGHIHVL